MKTLHIAIAAFAMLLIVQAADAGNRRVLKVATFNNQFENTTHPWVDRRESVYRLLSEESFDIVSMQEPFWNQVRDMAGTLGDYAWVGCATDGRVEDGYYHYNPVFYKKDRLEVLEWGRFWFSETPDVPQSKSWDAHTPRFCVWVHFKDISTGKDFYHFNSHFDHKGETARQESSRLLLARAAEIAGSRPVYFTGDFNTFENTPAYDIINESGTMKDALLVAKVREGEGVASWNDWKPSRMTEQPENFDHIFISRGTRVLSWRLITTRYDGVPPSDHYPIVIEWRY